jgi:hypothetical protein
MNERIKELAEQATSYMPGRPPYDGLTFDVFDKEKFAELIVLECNYLIQQQVSLKYKDGWEQSGISDDWACGHYAASILSRTVIKQHFGVKE